MLHHTKLTEDRLRHLIDNVLPAHLTEKVADCDVSIYQSKDPVPHDKAVKARYKKVKLPHDWGPWWSTAWFKLDVDLPREALNRDLFLEFDCGTEALLWLEGKPFRGFSTSYRMPREFHPRALVDAPNRYHGKQTFYIEAACNGLFGKPTVGSEQHEKKPGRLVKAHFAVRHQSVWDLYFDAKFLFEMMLELPEDSPRRKKVLYGLNEMANLVDVVDVVASAQEARRPLAKLFDSPAVPSASTVSSIGHSHIDVAWLWPYRETIRKCSRTFSTVDRLMDQYPEYKFIQSQAQLYAYTKEHYPELYERVKQRIKEGRWEVDGATWVEMDCNLSGGESIFRQILHAHRFFRAEFDSRSQFLWLPDVFGYAAGLPQMLVQCGIETFLTQKISWNLFNTFPYHTFMWEGIDGTQVFSHFFPTSSYNCTNEPRMIHKGERNFKEADRAGQWVNPFGYGDGGGGPNHQMIEYAMRGKDVEGMPKMKMEKVSSALKKMRRDAKDLPVWVGELYLEVHRGTYTTQARNKRYNRKCELLLRDLEVLMALGPEAVTDDDLSSLDHMWKLVLLNQFHDVIPGSSIGWVYEDSTRHYDEVLSTGGKMLERLQKNWADAMDTTGTNKPVVVNNTLSWERFDLVEVPRKSDDKFTSAAVAGGELDEEIFYNAPVQATHNELGKPVWLVPASTPSMGATVVDLKDEPPSDQWPFSVKITRNSLENDFLRVSFDQQGRIKSLFDKDAEREVVHPDGRCNQLAMYEDLPHSWDAWDVDLYYLEKDYREPKLESMKPIEKGPVRAGFEMVYSIGKGSTITQQVLLSAHSRRIDFRTHVDWHERHQLLRVLFPVDVRSDRATYEIQYGHLQRPTHFNTSWDSARFEVCAQKWADLSEPGYGVSLLNDCKYGHSVHRNVMGISLLRSSTNPDPEADQGEHRFTYSLYPHLGDLRDAGTIQEAYQLNVPLLALATSRRKGDRGKDYAGLQTDADNVIVEAVKPAENPSDGRVIVRAYEAYGERGPGRLLLNMPSASVEAVNPLEEPTDLYDCTVEEGIIEMDFTPFAIRTVAVKPT